MIANASQPARAPFRPLPAIKSSPRYKNAKVSVTGPRRGISGRLAQPRLRQRLALPLLQFGDLETLDQAHEQAVPVHFRLQVQEHRTQAYGRPVHEDELARRGDAAGLAQALVDAGGNLAAVVAAVGLLDQPRPVLHQGAVEE